MPRGISRADANRKIRREVLREELAARGLLQHVIENTEKLLDLKVELSAIEVARIGKGIDNQLALIKKFLPDVKQVELTGEDGDPIEMRFAGLTDKELEAIANGKRKP